MTQLLDPFESAILSCDRLAARDIFTRLKRNWTPTQLVENLIVPVPERIAAGWEQGTVALSQVYMGGRISEELVDMVLPPGAPNRRDQPKMAIATLEDYHLLGKRIIYSMLRANGFELQDYGRVEVEGLVRRAADDGIQVLLISALMLPSALRVKEVRAGLNESRPDIKIVVGGAPFRFDDNLWKDVGADCMGRNAAEAVERIAGMMEDIA